VLFILKLQKTEKNKPEKIVVHNANP